MTAALAGLSARIAGVVAIDPAADAVEFEGRWRTWGQLGDAVDQIARLVERPGTEVGILLRNRPSSVGLLLGVLQAGPEWGSFSVTFTPDSQELPAGWGGYGAEDPKTYEPILPEGITFADVMASVDEVAFTTFEPGWFFGATIFDVRIDNLRIEHTVGNDEVFANGFDGP